MKGEKGTIVIGPFVSVFGGAEVVKLHVAEFFLERGWRVVLAGLARDNFMKILNLLENNKLGKLKVYSLLDHFPEALGLYQPVIGFKAVERAVEELSPEAVFVDYEGSRRISELWRRKKFKLIKYIHFPQSLHLFVRKIPEVIPLEYLRDIRGYFERYEKSLLWKIYFTTYTELLERTLPYNPAEGDLLLVNSRYIGKLVENLFNVEPIVLYPPVNIAELRSNAWRPFGERDNAVIMIGRISPEKKYDEVINAISQLSSHTTLRIAGSLTRAGRVYLEKLLRLARENRVNLEVYPNVPRGLLADLLGRSKIFIHATRGEHFGIAIVEAMATGLPVIVHKSGGQFYDIIDKGTHGLYYENINELTKILDSLLTNENLWNKYRELSIKRSSDFSIEVFEKRLEDLVRDIGI